VVSPPHAQNGLVGIGWGFGYLAIEFSTTRCGIIEVSSEQIACVLPSHLARLFYWRTIVIKSQQAVVQNLCTKLQAHLDSGDALKVAIAKVKPLYNKATPEQQIEMRDEVAKVIGKYKGIKPKVMEKGDYKGYLGFDAHGTEEENQARSMLGYYFPAKKKKPNGSTQQVAKQVDDVEAILAMLYKLSAKEQQRFDVLYTKDKKAKRK
jgi:hypothetical protein